MPPPVVKKFRPGMEKLGGNLIDPDFSGKAA
jgi:hypothetical protein